MSSLTPSRRTVLRTAAWSVPVVSVATAAPAFAVSEPSEPTYQTVSRTFLFHPSLGGSPLTAFDIKVDVEARVPLSVPAGSSADPAQTVSRVTIPAALLPIIGSPLGNPAEVGGTSISTSNLTGAITATSITNLTIDRAPWPTSGDLLTVARGAGQEPLDVPAGTAPGAVIITLAPPNSTLVGYNAAGAQVGTYQSQLAPKAGQDYTLATFQIV